MAQESEITQTSGRLDSWGETVPTGDDTAGTDTGGDADGMGGLDVAESMTQLDAASGTDVDRALLELLTALGS